MVGSPNPFGQMFSPVREIATGIITAWSGSILGIPPGWALCDGTQGTPDLRNKFVVATGPTFAVASEGGSTEHNHEFDVDSHSHILPVGIGTQQGFNRPRFSDSKNDFGFTDNATSLPTYYALAYIMFIGS